MIDINDLHKDLLYNQQPEKSVFLSKYLDTKMNEPDLYLGVTVPICRKIAKAYTSLSFPELIKVVKSAYHEERLVALLILIEKFKIGDELEKREIVNIYLSYAHYINNWDLVDLSVSKILGEYLVDKSKNTLYSLAKSEYVWERRMSIVATFAFIKRGQLEDAIHLSQLLLNDHNPYIHKAVGWVLREVGKKNMHLLKGFLQDNYTLLPRLTLRYAIEHFPEEERRKYLKGIFF